MEIITGIRIENGVAVASAINAEGAELELRGEELFHLGLPNGHGREHIVRTNLRAWGFASFDEYAFAFRCPVGKECTHQAWSFVDDGTRFVVPALAMMRGLLRADIGLFHRLFLPQSLDDICTFSGGVSGRQIEVFAKLRRDKRRDLQSLTASLSWLYCFPTARRFWASAYVAAKQGRLDMALPDATVTLRVRSHQNLQSGNAYVTKLSLLEIEAAEEPFEFAVGHPRRIAVIPLLGTSAATQVSEPPSSLPAAYTVSDELWSAVEPVLRREAGPIADLRKLLNCVLQRLHAGATWEAANAVHGVTRSHASRSLTRWRRDGRWDALVPILASFGIVVAR